MWREGWHLLRASCVYPCFALSKEVCAMDRRGVQTDLQTMLRKARDLASTGNFANCADVADVLRRDPSLAMIETWLADQTFRAQLTELCEEGRKKRNANRT